MSWSTNHVPKYRKHRASGQAIVTIRGRDHYLGPHNTKASKVEYDRIIAEFLANGRQALHAEAHEFTVIELSARYVEFAKSYYRKRDGSRSPTLDTIVRDLQFLCESYGRQPAFEFGPLALKAIRQIMVGKGQSRGYVNERTDRIKRMFKWAVSEQLVPAETYQALAAIDGLRKGRTEARETTPILPVDDTVVDATLEYMPSVVADMVMVQRHTGARPAEICILRPCDLDRSDEVWMYKPKAHKTEHHGHDRLIHIGPRAQAILLRYLARDAQESCFRPCDSEKKRLAEQHSKRLTPKNQGNGPGKNRKRKPKREPGNRYETASYRRAIHRACDKAFPHPDLGGSIRKDMTDEQVKQLKQWQSARRWSPNQLRHAMATVTRSEFGLEAAQVILGHRSAEITQVYAESDAAKGREVARKIG